MATDHATVILGMDRRGHEQGLVAAKSATNRFGASLKPVNTALRGMQSGLRMLGVAGSTAIAGIAVRAMTRMASSVREARDEVNAMTAAGEQAAISVDTLRKAALIDDVTLARIEKLTGGYQSLSEMVSAKAAPGLMRFVEALAVVGESVVDFATGDNLFDAMSQNIERREFNTRTIAAENEEKRKGEAIEKEVTKLETRLLAIRMRASQVGLSNESKLNTLLRVQTELKTKTVEKGIDDAERMRRVIALEETRLEIQQTREKIAQEETREMEKQAREAKTIAEQEERALAAQLTARSQLATARSDRGAMSLGELASANVFTAAGFQQRSLAQQALAAEEFGAQAMVENRPDLRDKAFAFSDRIRAQLGALTTTERNPMGQLESQVEKSNESLAAIVTMAQTTGLMIQPRNADE